MFIFLNFLVLPVELQFKAWYIMITSMKGGETMKKDTTANRLKKIMEETGLRQIDILKRAEPYCKQHGVKLNKSDISQYVSGKVEPSQDKLYILGLALNVQESWLMGLDVPMKRKSSAEQAEQDVDLLQKYSMLSERDQTIIDNLISFMLKTD